MPPRGRDNTWLDASVEELVLEHRCFLLSAVAAGLLQKPGAVFAKDVQRVHAELSRLRSAKASAEMLGTTAILLWRIHAGPGQAVVGKMARRLHRDSRPWDRAAVRRLLEELRCLPVLDAGRRWERLV